MEEIVIYGGSEAKFTYLNSYKALAIQKPYVLQRVAIILWGLEGCGKGFSIEKGFEKMFGGQYRYMGAGMLNPNFNNF